MCSLSTPKAPPMPVYAPAPPPPEPEPVMDTIDRALDNETASTRAKRRGARGLRTDLGIPEQTKGVGLGIPQ